MRIPSEKVDEVRVRVSLVGVVSDYVTLKRSGARFVGLCPFHEEKTPSFSVNEEKGVFYCFGCGVGGNVFSFLMQLKGLSFPAAVEELARRAGVPLPSSEPVPLQKEKEKLYRLNARVAEFYRQAFHSSSGEIARAYLKDRGVERRAAEAFRLGYAPASWDALSRAAAREKLPFKTLEAAGLVAKRSGAEGYYDRFRHRLLFPIIDPSGHVLGFGGRVLDERERPKYLNSPETIVFSKGRTFYGLHATKEAIHQHRSVIVVEGYLDLISLWQAGIRNVVATLGTALTPYHVGILKRYTDQVTLLFDGDDAGRGAARRSLEPFLKAALFPRVVFLPEGEDPDQYVRNRGPQALLKRISEAALLLDVLLEEECGHVGKEVPDQVQGVDRILPLLRWIEEPVARNLYLNRCADRFGLPVSVLEERMRRGTPSEPRGPEIRSMESESIPIAERILVQSLVRYPTWMSEVHMETLIGQLRHPVLQRILRLLTDLQREERPVDPATVVGELSDPSAQQLFSRMMLEEEGLNEEEWREAFQEALLRVEKRHLREEQKRLSHELRAAQQSGDEALLRHLLETKTELKQREHKLGVGSIT